jgi:hypothetical protein
MQRPGETGWNNSCTAFIRSPFRLNATKIEPSENCDDDTGMFFPINSTNYTYLHSTAPPTRLKQITLRVWEATGPCHGSSSSASPTSSPTCISASIVSKQSIYRKNFFRNNNFIAIALLTDYLLFKPFKARTMPRNYQKRNKTQTLNLNKAFKSKQLTPNINRNTIT